MKRQGCLGSRSLGTDRRGTPWSREKELLLSSPTKNVSMGKVTWRTVYEPPNSVKKLRPVTRKVAMEQEYGFLFVTSSTVLLQKSRITQDFRVGIGTLLFAKGVHNTDEALVLHLLGLTCLLPFGHLESLTSHFLSTGQETI